MSGENFSPQWRIQTPVKSSQNTIDLLCFDSTGTPIAVKERQMMKAEEKAPQTQLDLLELLDIAPISPHQNEELDGHTELFRITDLPIDFSCQSMPIFFDTTAMTVTKKLEHAEILEQSENLAIDTLQSDSQPETPVINPICPDELVCIEEAEEVPRSLENSFMLNEFNFDLTMDLPMSFLVPPPATPIPSVPAELPSTPAGEGGIAFSGSLFSQTEATLLAIKDRRIQELEERLQEAENKNDRVHEERAIELQQIQDDFAMKLEIAVQDAQAVAMKSSSMSIEENARMERAEAAVQQYREEITELKLTIDFLRETEYRTENLHLAEKCRALEVKLASHQAAFHELEAVVSVQDRVAQHLAQYTSLVESAAEYQSRWSALKEEQAVALQDHVRLQEAYETLEVQLSTKLAEYQALSRDFDCQKEQHAQLKVAYQCLESQLQTERHESEAQQLATEARMQYELCQLQESNQARETQLKLEYAALEETHLAMETRMKLECEQLEAARRELESQLEAQAEQNRLTSAESERKDSQIAALEAQVNCLQLECEEMHAVEASRKESFEEAQATLKDAVTVGEILHARCEVLEAKAIQQETALQNLIAALDKAQGERLAMEHNLEAMAAFAEEKASYFEKQLEEAAETMAAQREGWSETQQQLQAAIERGDSLETQLQREQAAKEVEEQAWKEGLEKAQQAIAGLEGRLAVEMERVKGAEGRIEELNAKGESQGDQLSRQKEELDSQREAIRESIRMIEELQQQLDDETKVSKGFKEEFKEASQLLHQTLSELQLMKLDRDILMEQVVLLLQLEGIPHSLCKQIYEKHVPTMRYRAKSEISADAGPSSLNGECMVQCLDLERKYSKTLFQLKRSEQSLAEVNAQLSRRVADVRELKNRLQDQSAEFERTLYRERMEARKILK